jgi:mitochondrial-processing peptidase subunit alpha
MDPEPLLVEMLHKAAYNDNPLGNPKLCPIDNIGKITKENLYEFMNGLYKPERTVLACVGVDHEEFVKMTKERFETVKPMWQENPKIIGNSKHIKIDDRKNIWQGGSCLIEKDLSSLNQGSNNQLPELTHLMIGFESPAYLDEHDFVTSCVINTMMGGGGSFSAGGPGKGMYSRLYLNVLNRHHFMFSATAFNQSFSDSGIFYIHASAPPQYLEDMCNVIANELIRMIGPCNQVGLLF